MAGKVDSATHAAAVARIGEAVKHEADLRAHLEEIIRGAAFKGSHRSQAFLRHIVEHALHGESADLRERNIGVALFGRPATYDTADDAIVRVTASDVRKRLLQHYGNTGVESRFRINLPAGSYVPEFCVAPGPSPARSQAPVILYPPAQIPGQPMSVPEPTEAVPARLRWRMAALLGIPALAVLAALWFATRGANENLIVTAFQGSPRSVQVVVADDALVLIQVLLDHRFTLEEYENLTYLKAPEFVQKKDLLRFWGSLSTRQITNVGDLENANRIAADLRGAGWDVTIRQARQMHARAFRTGSFVILGSSLSNPWAALFPVNDSNFPFDELPRPGNPEVILNRHPRDGEPSTFEAHLDPNSGKKVTFARVYLVGNTAHSGRVLLVAGQSMSATEMAGQFLLRNDSTAQVRRMLGIPAGAPVPDIEMVLQVSEQNEIGDSVGLVAYRQLPQQSL